MEEQEIISGFRKTTINFEKLTYQDLLDIYSGKFQNFSKTQDYNEINENSLRFVFGYRDFRVNHLGIGKPSNLQLKNDDDDKDKIEFFLNAIEYGLMDEVEGFIKINENIGKLSYQDRKIFELAFMRAAVYDEVEIVKKLISFGMSPDFFVEENLHYYQWLAKQKAGQTLNYFLSSEKYAINPNMIDKKGNTFLHIFLQKSGMFSDDIVGKKPTKEKEFINYLSKIKFNFFLKNDKGDSCLHLAVESFNSVAVKKLIKQGCKISDENNKGNSSLYLGVLDKNYDVINSLLDNSQSKEEILNFRGKSNENILHLILNNRNFFIGSGITIKEKYDLIKKIIDFGIDPNIQHPSSKKDCLTLFQKNYKDFRLILIDKNQEFKLQIESLLKPSIN